MAEVYGDLFFMINMSMDYLCLHLSGRLMHRKISVARLLLASAIGGVYSVVALLLNVPALAAWGLDIAVCVLMCAVAFARRREGILLISAVYVGVSMVLGGIMTALYNLLNRAGVGDELHIGDDGISAWMFAILAAVSGILALGGGRFFRRSTEARPCKVSARVMDKTVSAEGICDSGNLVCDPIDGKPVIVIGREIAERLIGRQNVQNLLEHQDISAIKDDKLLRRLRFIPTQTATGTGVLVGFGADEILLCPEGGKERSVDALLAVMDTDSDTVLVPSTLMI